MNEGHSEPELSPQPDQHRRRMSAMPLARERGWVSSIASVLVHAFIIVLLILPSIHPRVLVIDELGAGGPGPAGGGGGGNRGTGGVRSERIQFVSTAEVAPAPVPVPPRIIPPIVEKKAEEVVPPPVVAPPVAAAKADSGKATEATAPIPGVGGGTGNDGSGGTGPGSGGGKGSGVGTGTGSGVGPGTGGGTGTIYPPSPIQLVILPLPAPRKVKPYELEATFDVDSTGHATLLQWNEPKDKSYARRVLDTLLGWRFRPAVRADGMPVRAMFTVRASIGK